MQTRNTGKGSTTQNQGNILSPLLTEASIITHLSKYPSTQRELGHNLILVIKKLKPYPHNYQIYIQEYFNKNNKNSKLLVFFNFQKLSNQIDRINISGQKLETSNKNNRQINLEKKGDRL